MNPDMNYAVTRFEPGKDSTVVAAWARTFDDGLEAVRMLMLNHNNAAIQATDDREVQTRLADNMAAIDEADFVADAFGMVRANGHITGYAVARIQ